MLENEKEDDRRCLLEGMVSLRALIEARAAGVNARPIERVLFDSGFLALHGREGEEKRRLLGFLRAMSREHGFMLDGVNREALDGLCEGTTHGGVVAVCGDRPLPSPSPAALPEKGFFMMLDGIEDPYNFGYAMRSVYAAGADGVLLPPRNWMSAAGTVCRASAGASERLPLYVAEGAEAVAVFHAASYKIVCADGDAEKSVWNSDAALSRPLLLVVGGERRGISKAVRDAADESVRLEYGRPFREALSAASSAAVLAFEVLRRSQ